MGKSLHQDLVNAPVDLLMPAVPRLQLSKFVLRTQARKFLEGFPGETSYAVKANPHPGIIAQFGHAGIDTFDVASTEEMQLVRSVLPTATMHYHNPVRSKEETAIALHAFGCRRFSVDHQSSLDQLLEQAGEADGIEVAIRFRMGKADDAVQNFQSKFGVNGDQAITLARTAKEMGFTVGLTFHPGSQTTNPGAYLQHMEEAARIAKAVPGGIDFLNMGGGFPASYRDMQTAKLEDYFADIAQAFDCLFGDQGVKLECEPGRALVAAAGTLVTTVKQARPETGELYLNDGIYGGLMEFHQFPSLQPFYECDRVASEGGTRAWTTYGPTCDPADVLPTTLQLPEDLQEGDEVRFLGIGAYSLATATRFNGYGAIEVELI